MLAAVGYHEVRNCQSFRAFSVCPKLTHCFPQLATGDARKAQNFINATRDGRGIEALAIKQPFDVPGLRKPLPEVSHFGPKKSFWEYGVKGLHFENFKTLSVALNQASAYYSFWEMCKGSSKVTYAAFNSDNE